MGVRSTKFAIEIDKAFQEEYVAKFVELHKTIATQAYKAVAADSRDVALKYGSPVMSGRYSASHTIAVNGVDSSTVPPHPDAGKLDQFSPKSERLIRAKPLSQVAAILRDLKPFDNITIANSLPYSRKIEFGHSRLKAPNGVYEITAAVIEQQFRNAKL